MKSHRLIFVLTLLLSWQSGIFAYHSDNFIIGTYTNLKPYTQDEEFNSLLLALMRQQGKYNVSICENTLPAIESFSNAETMLQAHYDYEIDPWLCDYHTGYNDDGELISAGPYSLSTGNHWLFEAEFFDPGIPPGYNDNHNNSNVYFHQFSRDISNRIGYATVDRGNPGNRKVWACSPDTSGVILHGLRYRFPVANAANASSSNYGVIGPEFRFTQWDRASWGETGHLGQHYLAWNKLYIRYVFRKVSGNVNDNALTFQVFCKNYNNNGHFEPVPIKCISDSEAPQDSLTYTFNQLISYSVPAYPLILEDEYRAITFEIDLNYLRGTNQTPSGDTFLNTAGYWNCSLFGIDPYIYSHGNGTVYLDNVEIFDKLYAKLEEGPPADAIAWLDARLGRYSNIGLQGVKSFYTLDEPQLPHFASYSKLRSIFEASSLASGKGSFATVNWNGGNYKKPNSQRFSLPELFTNPENGFEPEELMIDFYPLQPENNWNAASQDDLTGDLPIQSSLDYKMLSHYYTAKVRCKDIGIPFYVVPVSAGRWIDYGVGQDKWDYYMMPTANMQKCLQLLPLCYGVDGVINWKIYDNYASNDLFDNDREPYETASERSQHDVYPSNTVTKWFALVERNDTEIVSNTPQFKAICQANAKLDIYGNIMKTRGLNWVNALCIKSNGPDVSYVYNYTHFEPSPDVGSYLEDITSYDPEYPVNLAPYQGYVQVGFFEDSNTNPYYMAVNRRTDFVDNVTGKMKYLQPTQLRTHYNENGQASGFRSATSQIVSFELSNEAHSRFGSSICLYDPYNEHIYKQEDTEIKVEIDPGDGILLEMFGTLPHEVSLDYSLSNKAMIEGTVNIMPDIVVDTNCGTKTIIKSNSVINIADGASYTLRGEVVVEDNASFNVSPNGNLIFENATCTWGEGSKIDVVGAYLRISNGSMDRPNNAGRWAGIRATDSSTVVIEESTISGANSHLVTNSNLDVLNSSFYIPANSSGVILSNNTAGYETKIINTGSITDPNTGPTKGFYGDSNLSSNGIEISVMQNPVYIHKVNFQNLSYGIYKQSNPCVRDSISYCTFKNCANGIKLSYNDNMTSIISCDFINTQTEKQGTGIHLIASSPIISSCEFKKLSCGIFTEFSIFNLLHEPAYTPFIKESIFNKCKVGIESRASNHRLESDYFLSNDSGIVNHAGSNLNLSHRANNVMKNLNDNIKFYDAMPYESTIQLYTGHNDFYHLTDAVDFFFDTNYYNNTVFPKFRQIDASCNWFQDDQVTFSNPNYSEYVYVGAYDASPSMPSYPPGSHTLYMALENESLGLYELAGDAYRAILDDSLQEEETYITSAIDGLYRCTLMIPNPDWDLDDYFETKAAQHAVVDPSLSAIFTDYLTKVYVINKDFQAAVDLIQVRIDDPVCELDSIRAVLDLEIVLQMAAMEESKRPLMTKYAQYKYPDIEVFDSMHSNNWDKYLQILHKNEQNNTFPIPDKPLISSNYPNPFNPSTTIAYSVPKDGLVRIGIYNIKGQKVKDLCNSEMQRGHHKILWDGKDANQRSVSSGVYFVKLQASGAVSTRKIMLMK